MHNPGKLQRYTRTYKKTEERYKRLWTVGLFSGYERETRDVEITETWDAYPASPDSKLNKESNTKVIRDWDNNRKGNRTDKLGLGSSDTLDESYEINVPTGLKIVAGEVRLPDKGSSKPLDIDLSDADKVEATDKEDYGIPDDTSEMSEGDLYAKFATFGYTKYEGDVWLGFKQYIIGSTIDPLTVKGMATQIEGDAVEKALKSNGKMKLKITDIQKMEDRSSRKTSDGLVITYATYLITLGVISGE